MPSAAALLRRAAALRFGERATIFDDIVSTRFAQHPLFACDPLGAPFDVTRCPQTNPWAPPSSRDEVHRTATSVATALSEIPDAIAEIIFADYVERLIMFLLPPDRACAFLQCVAHGAAFRDLPGEL